MKKYILLAIIPAPIGEFETLAEAKQSMRNNIQSDFDTNAKIEYKIVLKKKDKIIKLK